MKTMTDLMLHFMQDILYAEKLGIREMAKMSKAVESAELKELFLHHREQSQQQVSRLERVFDMLGKRARPKTCAAMDGLTEEAEDVIDEGDRGPVRDAALIACAQAVEHYEIARYGALIAWAQEAGVPDAAALLQQTLDEEKEADRLFSDLAHRMLNPKAAATEEHAPEAHDEAPDEEPPAEEHHEEPAAEEPPAPRRRATRKAKAVEPEPEPEPEPAPAPRAKRAPKAAAAKPKRTARK